MGKWGKRIKNFSRIKLDMNGEIIFGRRFDTWVLKNKLGRNGIKSLEKIYTGSNFKVSDFDGVWESQCLSFEGFANF